MTDKDDIFICRELSRIGCFPRLTKPLDGRNSFNNASLLDAFGKITQPTRLRVGWVFPDKNAEIFHDWVALQDVEKLPPVIFGIFGSSYAMEKNNNRFLSFFLPIFRSIYNDIFHLCFSKSFFFFEHFCLKSC